MARNYSANSTINLQVNAKQASQMMSKLKKETADLERQFQKAEKAGDKVQMKNLRRQIRENQKMMRLFATETAQTADILNRLDKASPKELKKALSTLQGQLQGMQRGTKEWTQQVEKIRKVREEISRMNASMSESKSWWSKIKDEIFSVQNIIMAASAALMGFVAAGRKAVSEFTKMNEAETDTRKFTGLTADGIRELNDTFKAMDTRTAREKLNELAQEAGRLGKNTQETIMGYVKGADVLNVALSDLGSGATEKVAKLSNIFKIEDQYGTYDAMLKVGSVINVLSQNCTASKPYLVEFANRLAGVGAQAQLSLQNIIGFGAVLDSNAQALEASATAIGQVLTRMYQDPAKYAKVAGMDVKKFTDTLNNDANAALIMFLEHLSKAKDLSVLSPMFKDMGENGARVITALSTLAKHIDEVKEQQLNANRAFDEGTSVLNEYGMFNNTAQASLDKAQKRMKELTIELGEKLYPIMSHIYSSSSLLLRALSHIVTFVVENKTAVASLALAMASYGAAVLMASARVKIMSGLQAANAAIMSVEKGVVLLASAAYNLMTGNIARASASMRVFNMVMKANPIGMVAAAIGLLIPLIVKLCSHTDTYIDKAKKVIEKNKEVSESVLKEQRELGILVGKLKAAEKGSEDYKKMKDQLISQYGKYLSGLIDEKGEIIDLAAAYDTLSKAIDRSNRLRNVNTAKNELEQEYDKDQMNNINGLQKALENFGADPQTVGSIIYEVSKAVGSGTAVPKNIIRQIEEITNNGTPQFSDGGTKLNSVSRPIARGPEIPGVVHVTDPVDYLNKITRSRSEYKTSKETLDNIELGINPTKNIPSNELLKSYNALIKIAEGNHYDYANVPNYYLADDIPTAYFGNVFLSDDDKRHQQAAKDRATDAGKYVKNESGNENAKDTNPLTSKDPNASLSTAVDKYKVDVNFQQRDKTSGKSTTVALSPAEAQQLTEQIAEELRLRGVEFGKSANKQSSFDGVDKYSASEKESKASSSGSAKEDKLKNEKEWREMMQAQAMIKRAKGYSMQEPSDEDRAKGISEPYRKPYTVYDYEAELLNIDKNYYSKILKRQDLDKSERTEYEAKFYENRKKRFDYVGKLNEEEENIRYNDAVAEIKNNYVLGLLNKDEYKQALNDEELMHFAKLVVSYQKLAKDAMESKDGKKDGITYDDYQKKADEYDAKLTELEFKNFEERNEKLLNSYQEFKKKFEKEDPVQLFEQTRQKLDELLSEGRIDMEQYLEWTHSLAKSSFQTAGAPDNSKTKAKKAKEKYDQDKQILDQSLVFYTDEKEYSVFLSRMKSELRDSLLEPLKESKSEWVSLMTNMTDSWMDFVDALNDPDKDPLSALAAGIEATAAVMAAVTSQITEFTKAQTEIQIAAVQRRYDREIAFAEGNSYMTKKLEKERQQEIAKIKEQAANKEFAMQVISAIAQTATNALNAYGSAAAIPVVGHVLAPIAAGIAVAQGMVQVALIKKQKEAAAATGYSEGGFTRPGAKDEPAGIVHAGEWVASQKLVNSPVARPMIDMLEYAQRTNTIASLSMDDVSRSISAPLMLAYSKPEPQQVQFVSAQPAPEKAPQSSGLDAVIDRLNRRLDQPFVTVNTVAGELGSKQAQDKYNRMMRNKSRKSR